MEIEKLAAEKPEAILRQPVDPRAGLPDFAARRLAFELKIPAERVGGILPHRQIPGLAFPGA